MVARDTILAVPSDGFHRERGNPLPEAGADFVAALIAEIEEDERLSAALGVDLTPAAPEFVVVGGQAGVLRQAI
jgi:hypothetical protein